MSKPRQQYTPSWRICNYRSDWLVGRIGCFWWRLLDVLSEEIQVSALQPLPYPISL
ncbi:MAG: hypothetical protein PVH50_11165 [Anaerolineae bacterium]